MCRQELKGKIVTDEVFAKIVQNMEEDKYQEEMENYRSAALLQDPLPDIFNEVEFPVLDILDILNNIRN